MKKRIIFLGMILLLILPMYGCAQSKNEDVEKITEESTEMIGEDISVSTEKEIVEMVVSSTEEPKSVPTEETTIEPTATPTAEPTATPTAEPTATPTVAPTATPTVAPTAAPTVAPTAAPTVAPTAPPTAEPTAAPAVHKHTMVYRWRQEEPVEKENCMTRGRIVDICAECGYVEKVHSDWMTYSTCIMGEVVYLQERTCFQDGIYLQYCVNCGMPGEVRTSPAKGEHTMEQKCIAIVGATCSTEGYEVIRHYCKYCDEATYEETIVRPINDYHPASSRTYTNDEGVVVWVYTCVECGLQWEEIR